MEDKPRRNEELGSLEEGLPRLTKEKIGEGSEESQGSDGCGDVMDFTPKFR